MGNERGEGFPPGGGGSGEVSIDLDLHGPPREVVQAIEDDARLHTFLGHLLIEGLALIARNHLCHSVRLTLRNRTALRKGSPSAVS